MSKAKKENEVKPRVMIIVPHYWGKGDTITEAWQQVKKESCGNLRDLKAGRFMIYVCFDKGDQKSKLDEFGFNITYPEGHPPILIEKRDWKSDK